VEEGGLLLRIDPHYEGTAAPWAKFLIAALWDVPVRVNDRKAEMAFLSTSGTARLAIAIAPVPSAGNTERSTVQYIRSKAPDLGSRNKIPEEDLSSSILCRICPNSASQRRLTRRGCMDRSIRLFLSVRSDRHPLAGPTLKPHPQLRKYSISISTLIIFS